MSVNIRPLGDRIIVEPVEQEETIAGGMLVLPETAKEKPQQGKVLAVGAGRRDDDGKRIEMDVEVGRPCCSPSTRARKSSSAARNC